MIQSRLFFGVLMAGAVIVHAAEEETSFTFTTESLESPFGYVTKLRDDITTSSGYWAISGSATQTPIDMSLRTTVLSGTDCTANKFQIYYNARHTSTEGDGAIIISAGDEYISFMFDYDGGVIIATGYTGGIAIWPPCGSTQLPQIPNNSTNPSDLFDDSTDTNSVYSGSSFYNWRDRMAGGNRDNWSQFNSASRVGSHTTGFNVGFEMENTTMSIAFWTEDGAFSTQCDMNTVFSFAHGSDINVDFSPDYDDGERWRVYGITVTTDCSAETIEPSMTPSDAPVDAPTNAPSAAPSNAPINAPTQEPTIAPSASPSGAPSGVPSNAPTNDPSDAPSQAPTRVPTSEPTNVPSASPSSAPINEPTQQPTVDCVSSVLQCPSACSTDPCECDSEEIGDCNQNTCHSNGCDQCNNGSFKKYYNYPCVSCQETFGSDCMHCTDFLGCQQCSNGVRTYDSECGLYYCNTC